MPQIETWSRLRAPIRNHLVERLHDGNISLEDLNQLRLWMESKPTYSMVGGSTISGPSNSAAKANTLKRSCFTIRLRADKSCNRERESGNPKPLLYASSPSVLLCKRHKDNRLKDRSASG